MQRIYNALIVLMASALLCSAPAQAISLEEYGVTLTGTGLVDQVSGLRWLDSSLTFGLQSALDPYLADGWRIATEYDVAFLLTHSDDLDPLYPGFSGNVPLQYAEFVALTQALGIQANGDVGSQPWMCRVYSADISNCYERTGSAFVSFGTDSFVDTDNSDMDGFTTYLNFYLYITEVSLYGDLDGPCPDCLGRTLLVRAIPLPAALWMLLPALGWLGWLKRSAAVRYYS